MVSILWWYVALVDPLTVWKKLTGPSVAGVDFVGVKTRDVLSGLGFSLCTPRASLASSRLTEDVLKTENSKVLPELL